MSNIWYYVIGINLLGFFLMGLDKYFAIKGHYRISENTLLSIVLIGGSLGSLLGMLLFRHKTKKKRFFLGIPLCILIHIYYLIKVL